MSCCCTCPSYPVAQVLAWLLQLASVGIKCWGMQISSLKGERTVLVHVCVGIALQVLIGVQARLCLLRSLKLMPPDRRVALDKLRPHARLLPLSSVGTPSANRQAGRRVSIAGWARLARRGSGTKHGSECSVCCLQALIALLFRPSHTSSLWQTWSVVHRCAAQQGRKQSNENMQLTCMQNWQTHQPIFARRSGCIEHGVGYAETQLLVRGLAGGKGKSINSCCRGCESTATLSPTGG